MQASRLYRLWAFHSAALDLALRQAGTIAARRLRREPRADALRRVDPARRAADARAGQQAPGARPDAALQARRDQLLDARAVRRSWSRPAPSTRSTSRASTRAPSSTRPPIRCCIGGSSRRSPTPGSRIPTSAPGDGRRSLADEHERITWDAPIHFDRRHRGAAVPPADGQHQALADRLVCASCARPTTTATRTGSAPTAAARRSSALGAGRRSIWPRCSTPTPRTTSRRRATTRPTAGRAAAEPAQRGLRPHPGFRWPDD